MRHIYLIFIINRSCFGPIKSCAKKKFHQTAAFRQIGPGGNGVAAGARKLVIKNLKKKPALPDNFEERSIAKLRRAVVAIQGCAKEMSPV